jgi:tRNA nucleotidyltransferase/poly(A) polymerase
MPAEPKPFLTGEDVMKTLKIKPGKKVGKILAELREKQLDGEIKNKKQALDCIKKLA